MSTDGYLPIENHGVIGDLHTVALVGTDGAIDFMSYPPFGSSTIFASLLDGEGRVRHEVNRPVRADERHGVQVTDDAVVLDREVPAVTHGPYLPSPQSGQVLPR